MTRKTFVDRVTVLKQLATLVAMDDPEALLLKGHLVAERFLLGILATRLQVDEDEVPQLSFADLSETALVGPKLAVLRGFCRSLNRLRNHCSHSFSGLSDVSAVERFLSAFGFEKLASTEAVGKALKVCIKYIVIGTMVELNAQEVLTGRAEPIDFIHTAYAEVTADIEVLRKHVRALELTS